MQVTFNGKVVSSNITLSNVQEIRAWGRGGNDKISVLSLEVPTLLHGGAGNDQILGGAGSNLLFGGTGNDSLTGGTRNDLLVGDAGTDTITDPSGDNVFVGGNMSDQFSDDFLRHVLQQWRNGKSQNSRFKLGLVDDDAVDSLFDSLGDDWFIIGDGDTKDDRYPADHDSVNLRVANRDCNGRRQRYFRLWAALPGALRAVRPVW